jgi:hypothetical protein
LDKKLAEDIERILVQNGGMNDPRTLALYLATRGQRVQQALELAEAETNTRADIFTMDTLAWAFNANGRPAEAREFSKSFVLLILSSHASFAYWKSAGLVGSRDPTSERLFSRAPEHAMSWKPVETVL